MAKLPRRAGAANMSDAFAAVSRPTIDLSTLMQRDTAFRPHVPNDPVSARRPFHEQDAAEAYERGLAEGQRLAEVGHEVERRALVELLAGAEALQDEPCPQLANLIASAVELLVEHIVRELPVDSVWLNERIAEACAIITEADKDRVLHLNPADLHLVSAGAFGMELRGDPQVPRGGLRIATGDGWVEHGRPVYLDALRRTLGIEGATA
jgi:flagellar assembly protein FliH